MSTAKPKSDRHFLPDFCDFRVAFVAVVIAELVAVLTSLAPFTEVEQRWRNLTLTTVFVQWVALTSTGLLCALKHLLGRLSLTRALFASWLVLLAVTAAASHGAFWLDHIDRLNLTVPRERYPQYMLGNLLICALVGAAALRYLYMQAEWKRNVEAQSEMRVRALQARIRPHFLFNSMNTIASLIREKPKAAEAAVEDLSDLFRASLETGESRIPLRQELEHARRYVHIEQLRLGKRLRVDWRLDQVPGEARMPPLILQPLIENAIYHGVQMLPDGGTIVVSGQLNNKRLSLRISNPIAPGAPEGAGLHMALDNIGQRLQHAFAGRGRLEQSSRDGEFTVVLTFPLELAG